MKKRHAHYDTYDYPSYWKGRNYEHESEVVALKAFLSKIGPIKTMADIGAGFGRLSPYYQDHAKKIIFAEPSQSLIDVAQQNLKKDKITFLQTTVQELGEHIPKGSLDALMMVRVMHHMSDPADVIKTFSSLLKKNGFLILEFANKIHGKALFKNFCRGDFTFPIDLTPTDRRCYDNQQEGVISFYNYHPDTIFQALKSNNFKTLAVRSVSNVRSGSVKKYLPFNALISLEKALQEPLSQLYFGPSIFILAQKHAQ